MKNIHDKKKANSKTMFNNITFSLYIYFYRSVIII